MPGSNSKSHKYSLIQNDETESLNDSKSGKKGMFKSNGIKDIQMGSQLNYNEDEDVVYEESSMTKSNGNKNNVKKYNLI